MKTLQFFVYGKVRLGKRSVTNSKKSEKINRDVVDRLVDVRTLLDCSSVFTSLFVFRYN